MRSTSRRASSKKSPSTEQPVQRDELRAIKRYLHTREDKQPWLFTSERGQPMTRQAVNYLIREGGELAGLGRVWPRATPAASPRLTKAPTFG
jgi:type 1 fimbriae regulatory protein FimB